MATSASSLETDTHVAMATCGFVLRGGTDRGPLDSAEANADPVAAKAHDVLGR